MGADAGVDPILTAPTLHTHMLDTNKTAVPVQLFHSSYHDLNDDICYVIGISETGEHGRARPDAELNCDLPNTLMSIAIASSTGDSSSVTSDSTLVSNKNSKNTFVWIDAFSPTLEILHCTENFGALCGPSASSTGFLDWLENKEEFVEWCLNFVRIQNSVNAPPSSSSHMHVKL